MSDVVVGTEGPKEEARGGVGGAGVASGPLPLTERLSDRLNPILLREVQQALNGRAFLVTLWLALLGIVIVALNYASGGDLQRSAGGSALTIALMILTPIIGLVVPFIAFLSMRQEVSSGTVEHLMLSRLTPASVVRGKLAAAVVQIVIVISLFAPLLAVTWLLRGVDVATIAVLLTLALLGGIGAVSLGICGGALCRWRPARAILVVVLALGFTFISITAMAGMWLFVHGVASVLAGPEFRWLQAAWILIPIAAAIALLMLTAGSALTHPNENRSTGFRLFALLGIVAVYAWVAWVTYDISSRRVAFGGSSRLAHDAPEIALALALATFLFWLFAVTEEETLSPRVRAHVPRSGRLALLVAPLLPGGGRGVLFVLLMAAITLLGAALLPVWVDGKQAVAHKLQQAGAAWAYVVFYAALGRFLRGRMAAGSRGTVMARIALPLAILLLALLPTVIDLVSGVQGREWSATHLTNPFSTLDAIHLHIDRHPGGHDVITDVVAFCAPFLLAAIGLVVSVPAMLRGIVEALAASKARRARTS